MSHASYPAVQEAATKYGFSLVPGKGNDPDTLGKQLVYVYDSKKFPFYQGEVYHQVSEIPLSPPLSMHHDGSWEPRKRSLPIINYSQSPS